MPRPQQRRALIQECQRRTGLPSSLLEASTLRELQEMRAESSHELLIDENDAKAMLDPEEAPRVHEFVSAAQESRSLLAGLVSASTFVECFVIWSGVKNHQLLQRGRSLHQVVETIQAYGGMAAAAAETPWLEAAVPLAERFSFERIERERIFVRHASAGEALSTSATCHGRVYYIEEGQHRAIAAAWTLLMSNSSDVLRDQSIAYVRGVNRKGAAEGTGFWRLHGTDASGNSTRYPTAELCSGGACLLLTWRVARFAWRGSRGRACGVRGKARSRRY